MEKREVDSTFPPISPNHQAAVIGAGPAGLAYIGTLLDNGVNSILWIDPCFNAGRLSNYPEVPSNTKLRFFIQYINGSSTFKEAIRLSREMKSEHISIFDIVDKEDPERIVPLSYAIDIIKSLTEIVLEHYKPRITLKVSKVTRIEGKTDSDWTLHTDDGNKFKSDLVFLATGSAPNELEDCRNPAINSVVKMFADDAKSIDIDLSLYPTKLVEAIKSEDTVAVIGSSHSAILALRNLVELPEGSRPKKIYNFYSSELKYAVYMDGWILYDGTGLKGDTARWAKENLSQDETNIEGLKRFKLDDVMKNQEQYREELKGITGYVLCIGFKRNTLPEFVIDGEIIKEEQISYDDNMAHIIIKRDIEIPTMLGNGIAFPERIVDPLGNAEYVVGLWKSMKFALKTIPPVLEKYLKREK